MMKWIFSGGAPVLRQLRHPTSKQTNELQTKKNKFALSPITYETYRQRF
jgi:hypothetical protein